MENIWTSGTLSYTVTGLEGGAKYDIQIRAKGGSRVGPWSEPEVVEPTLSVPTAPSIGVVMPGDRTLGVTWTPPPEAVGDEITSYDLRYILTSADETVDANWTVRTSRVDIGAVAPRAKRPHQRLGLRRAGARGKQRGRWRMVEYIYWHTG